MELISMKIRNLFLSKRKIIALFTCVLWCENLTLDFKILDCAFFAYKISLISSLLMKHMLVVCGGGDGARKEGKEKPRNEWHHIKHSLKICTTERRKKWARFFNITCRMYYCGSLMVSATYIVSKWASVTNLVASAFESSVEDEAKRWCCRNRLIIPLL